MQQVSLFAINVPLESDNMNQAYDMIKKRNYTFPVIKILNEPVLDSFKVKVFHTTLIINENGTVIFNGSIENAFSAFSKLLKNKNQ